MMKRRLFFLLVLLIAISCGKPKKKYPKLEMSREQVINVLVQIYSVNAANELNDSAVRDSMANVYMDQVSEITGIPVSVIRSDLDKLKKMPDSLFVLQSAAMDTLRAVYEKHYYKTKNESE